MLNVKKLKAPLTYGYVSEIEYIYPALSLYMKDYVFSCGKLSEELTLYFKEYKEQKLTSKITPAFLEKVNSYALKQPYAHLETRDSAILRIPEKQSAFLLWIDALGVEYLAYMSELARKKGLSMRTDITYSELPTITSINRGFFDIWPGPMKEKEPKLDDIKHHEQGGFIFREDDDAPIEGFEGHFEVARIFEEEVPLPFGGFFLRLKTSFELAICFALPVGISRGDIPCSVFVFVNSHFYLPPWRCSGT